MATSRGRSVWLRVLFAIGLAFACSSQSSDSENVDSVQQALTGLEVFVRDEASSDTTTVKPRIYIRNGSASAIANFSVHYYFTIDTGKTPVVEDWSTPNSSVTVQRVQGNLYRLVYNHAGFTLQPGAVTPNTSGDVVGLHYSDNSTWTRADDWSYLGVSASFTATSRIVIVSASGIVLSGTPPSGIPGSGGASGSGGSGAGTATTVTVTLPAHLSQTSVALGAHDRLLVRDRGAIRYPSSNSYPAITNAGQTETDIGVNSNVGTIYSRAAVKLRGTNPPPGPGVHGDVNSVGNVTRLNNHFVSGAINAPKAIDFRNRTLTFQIPAIPAGTTTLNTGQSATLSAGPHQGYTLNSGSTLRLKPGRHYMGSLNVNAGASLRVENSNQPVEVFLSGALTFNGSLLEDGTGDTRGNFRIVLLGQGQVDVLSRFIGTVLAPKSVVRIARTAEPHEGSFFGRTLELAADAAVNFVPFRSSMIVSIETNKSTVCRNEPIEVKALVRPLNEGDVRAPETSINGKPGTMTTLQYPAPGRYPIVVAATQDGVTQSRQITITVNDCTNGYPRVFAAPEVAPYTSRLTVQNAEEFPGATYAWDFGDGATETSPFPSIAHDYSASLLHDRDLEVEVSLTLTRAGQPAVTVRKPLYFRNMYAAGAQRGFARPLVKAPQRFQKIDKELVGTYNVRNVEPNPITLTERWTERHFCDPDREPERVDETLVEVGRDWTLPHTIAARSTSDLTLVLKRKDFGSDVCAVTEYLAGRTQGDNLDIRISASFETREPGPFGYEVTDPQSLTVLRKVVAENLVVNPNEFTQDDLENLLLERRIDRLPVVNTPAAGTLACVSGGSAADCLGQVCEPEQNLGPPLPGLSCQRTDRFRLVPGLVRNARKGDLLLVPGCELLGQILRKVNPPEGYVHEGIMTRNYVEVAHSFSMAERTIRGAQEEREVDPDLLQFEWPGAAVETTSAAFAECPGRDCATEFVDPQGFRYTQPGFSPKLLRCHDEITQLHPLVVRPAPRQTYDGPRFTPAQMLATRTLLHNAADFARSQHQKTHYRLFTYTRGDAAFLDAFDSPASSSIGGGRPATNSSQFVWFSLKSTPGITLEGTQTEQYVRCNPIQDPVCDPTNPPNEEQDGARIIGGDTQTSDGLYAYTEDERVAGLREVRRQVIDRVYDQVIDACPICPEWSDNAVEAAADQAANCFAVDDCSQPRTIYYDTNGNELPSGSTSSRSVYTGNKWQNAGTGFTLSPDHFLFWDPPFYGDWEQMQFMSATYMPIYQWVMSNPTEVGIVPVHVTLKSNGDEVADAVVSIAGQDARTDADGNVTFVGVAAGNHTVDGTFGSLSDSKAVTVVAGATSPVVELQLTNFIPAPPTAFIIQRILSVNGSIDATDVDGDSGNETANFPFSGTCVMDTFTRNGSFATPRNDDFCVDEEVSSQVVVNCRLLSQDDCLLPENAGTGCVADETIKVTARLLVEEEDECWTDDQDCGSFGDLDGWDHYENTQQINLPPKCDAATCPVLSLSIPRNQGSCDGPASDEAFADATLRFSNINDAIDYTAPAFTLTLTRPDATVATVSTSVRRLCNFSSAAAGPGMVTAIPGTPPELTELCIEGFRTRVNFTCDKLADLHTVNWTDAVTLEQTATCAAIGPMNPVLANATQSTVHALPQTAGPAMPLTSPPLTLGTAPGAVATVTLNADALNRAGAVVGTFPDVKPDMARRLVFQGGISITDDDGFLDGDDEVGNFNLSHECLVDPFTPTDSWFETFCVDDEVTVTIQVDCSLNREGVVNDPAIDADDFRMVNVQTRVWMYEEATCNSTDEDGSQKRNLLAPNCTRTGQCPLLSLEQTADMPNNPDQPLVITNTDEGGDRAEIRVTFTNRPNCGTCP